MNSKKVALAFAITVALALPTTSAKAEEEFDATFTSPTILEVQGQGASLHELAFAVHHKGKPADGLRAEVAFQSLRVIEYHLSWLVVQHGTGEPWHMPPDVGENSTTVFGERGSIIMRTTDPWAAAAVLSENADCRDWRAVQAEGLPLDPFLTDSAIADRTAVPPNPNERFTWQLEGPRIKLKAAQVSCSTSGTTQLYWHLGEAAVSTPAGDVTFASRLWNERIDPANVAERRHLVWHVAHLGNASGNVWIQTGNGASATAYAHDFQVPQAGTIAIDAASLSSGALPVNQEVRESAVWIRGVFAVASSAQRLSDGSTSMTVRAAGKADAFSVGGGPVWDIRATTAVLASAVLMFLVYALRNLLGASLLRVALPLYSHLRPDNVLDQPTRAAIFHLVQTNQGIVFQDIRAMLTRDGSVAFGNGNLLYHLWQLERLQRVRSILIDGRRAYFEAAKFGSTAIFQHAVLANSDVRKIAIGIISTPGCIQKELTSWLCGNPKTVRQRCRHHLRKLLSATLITEQRDGRSRRYNPTNALRELLRCSPSTSTDEPRTLMLEDLKIAPSSP